MFPISHVYMLNKLVNRKFGRNLDKDDAEQIMGVWLLDAIVSHDLREKFTDIIDTQAYFHTLQYKSDDPLQAGMKIHVFCDNLANCGNLIYDGSKNGFVGKHEASLYVPDEAKAKDSENLRRRMLQCGLDMLIVNEAKDQIKEYFSYATDLFKKNEMYDKVYMTFANLIQERNKNQPEQCIEDSAFAKAFAKALVYACAEHLKGAIERYGPGFEYTACEWRRASAAREIAGKDYCEKVSMLDLIKSNLGVLDGWENDISHACGKIIGEDNKNKELDVFHTFS